MANVLRMSNYTGTLTLDEDERKNEVGAVEGELVNLIYAKIDEALLGRPTGIDGLRSLVEGSRESRLNCYSQSMALRRSDLSDPERRVYVEQGVREWVSENCSTEHEEDAFELAMCILDTRADGIGKVFAGISNDVADNFAEVRGPR